jgi:hypothetical protein
MKRLTILSTILVLMISLVTAQNDNGTDKDWLIETEPSAFILNGFHLMVGKNITKDNKLLLSAFVTATDVGETLRENIYANTDKSYELRLGMQASLNLRYKIELFKEKASNPYLGLIAGWEYFTLSSPLKQDLRTDVFLLTPYVGHTIFIYKQMIYLNPQLRAVFYVSPVYSMDNRVETMNSSILLPQVSLGVRF